eukprot:scaffold34794_cov34-Phaeocystis_antarctica.AAC.2
MLRNLSKTPSSAAAAVASSTLGSSVSLVSSTLGASLANGEAKRRAARSGEGRGAHGDACQASGVTARRKTAMTRHLRQRRPCRRSGSATASRVCGVFN